MPFALHGTHISGGNFNNVSGNMTQVFNSQTVYGDALAADQEMADDRRLRSSYVSSNPALDHPMGAIRTPSVSSHPNFRPCDASNWGDIQNDQDQGIVDHQNGTVSSFSSGQFPRPSEVAGSAPVPPVFADTRSVTYNSVGGNMTQQSFTSYGESGLDILSREVVSEALHDSSERFPEPACHPGTRTAVLKQLRSWSIDTSPETRVMWLHGSAGVGKSAIAQMFAGDCQQQGRLGASFFFKRGHVKRGTWTGLFSTIAYQLAISIPGFTLPMQQAVEADKLVVRRALPVQFQKLILEPFHQITPLAFFPIIVLDGLDECADHKTQQQIFRLFIDAVRETQLPIRMLICSRPEPHLRELVETEHAAGLCSHFILSADETAFQDIRTYLCHEFFRINCEYRTRGIELGAPWPPPDALDHLVTKSSGIFIYATTVIAFIDDEYSHPTDRLHSVLALDPQSTAPLDDLYTAIISVVPHSSQWLRILHVLWKGSSFNLIACDDPEEIDTLLKLRPGTTRLMLRGVHSLFTVPPIPHPFAFPGMLAVLHTSLLDYLGDARRSGPWCVSIPWLHYDYLVCTIQCLSSPGLENIRTFNNRLVSNLAQVLLNATPCEHLFELMRNETFQKSLFLSTNPLRWPQWDSGYPWDLIQLWEEYDFFTRLERNLEEPRSSGRQPTFKFDSIYSQIISKHPDLSFVLRAWARGLDPYLVMRVFGLSYNVLRPFLVVRGLVDVHREDSPLEFLSSPVRAGELCNEQATTTEIVARWIARAKGFVAGETWLYGHFLNLNYSCDLNTEILRELETLHLSKLCEVPINGRYHDFLYDFLLHPEVLRLIIQWLWMLPDPPMQVIQFWQQQIAYIAHYCTTRCQDPGVIKAWRMEFPQGGVAPDISSE